MYTHNIYICRIMSTHTYTHTLTDTHIELIESEGHETHLTANVISTTHLIRAAELKEGDVRIGWGVD